MDITEKNKTKISRIKPDIMLFVEISAIICVKVLNLRIGFLMLGIYNFSLLNVHF